MKRIVLRVVLVPLAVASLVAAQPPSFDSAKAASGRVTFQRYCASCHGAGGKGDGRIASILKVPVADLTRIVERNGGAFPAEKVREIVDGRQDVVAHGLREMPVWGDALQRPELGGDQEEVARTKIDQLVEYIKSLQVR